MLLKQEMQSLLIQIHHIGKRLTENNFFIRVDYSCISDWNNNVKPNGSVVSLGSETGDWRSKFMFLPAGGVAPMTILFTGPDSLSLSYNSCEGRPKLG